MFSNITEDNVGIKKILCIIWENVSVIISKLKGVV